jgi:hypothetical protein
MRVSRSAVWRIGFRWRVGCVAKATRGRTANQKSEDPCAEKLINQRKDLGAVTGTRRLIQNPARVQLRRHRCEIALRKEGDDSFKKGRDYSRHRTTALLLKMICGSFRRFPSPFLITSSSLLLQKRQLQQSVQRSLIFTSLICESFDSSNQTRAVSSVVEHCLDTAGVTGSNPVSRTIFDFNRVMTKS